MKKREFIKSLAGIPMSLSVLEKTLANYAEKSPQEIAEDETFWTEIRKGFRLKPDYINLENGYYCMQPQEVLEKFVTHVREINFATQQSRAKSVAILGK